MGKRTHHGAKAERKAARQNDLVEVARQGTATSEDKRFTGILSLVTLFLIMGVLSFQLPLAYVLASIAMGSLFLKYPPWLLAPLAPRILQGLCMIANYAFLKSTRPGVEGHAMVAFGSGLGIAYACEYLERFLADHFDWTPVLAKERKRQLQESGKEGMAALKRAQREAAYQERGAARDDVQREAANLMKAM